MTLSIWSFAFPSEISSFFRFTCSQCVIELILHLHDQCVWYKWFYLIIECYRAVFTWFKSVQYSWFYMIKVLQSWFCMITRVWYSWFCIITKRGTQLILHDHRVCGKAGVYIITVLQSWFYTIKECVIQLVLYAHRVCETAYFYMIIKVWYNWF